MCSRIDLIYERCVRKRVTTICAKQLQFQRHDLYTNGPIAPWAGYLYYLIQPPHLNLAKSNRILDGETRTRIRADYLTTECHTFLIGNLQYRKKDANTFDSRGTIHIRGIRKFNTRLMIEGFLQKQYSGSILLKDRNLAGGGFRLSPLRSNEKRQIDLYLGIGAMWENELIDDQKLGEFETSILRSTNYATLIWQVDDRFSTATTGYFQMRPNDTNDFRLLVESGFGVRLSKRISLNVELNFRFDNEPPGGIEKHDLEIANSLTLSL